MDITTLKQGESFTVGKGTFTVDYNMRDYSTTPFYKRKLAEAEAEAKAEVSIAKCLLPDMGGYLNQPSSEVDTPMR